jgi:imidazolonepropionase-like amidohydrolase
VVLGVVAALACAATFAPSPSSIAAAAGLPRVHAITGARIVTAPGQVIERGTVVMRDGIITAVGATVAIPPDARVWNGDSLTVYPGLIDACVLPAEAGGGGGPRPAGGPGLRPGQRDTDAPARGAAASLASVVPEYRVIENLALSADQLKTLREAGFTVAHIAPRRGIFRGQSAVVALGDGALNRNTLAADAAQVVSIEAMPQSYPGSLMGAIAVIRQGFLDARWYRDAQAAYARQPVGIARPETNHSWAALQGALAGTQPVWMLADDMLEVLRAAAIAREAGIRTTVVGSGDEYKRVREIAATALPLVVPVNFPEAPEVGDPGNLLEVTTEELRHWQSAPGNAAALARAGIRFALTSHGMKDAKGFRANIGKAVASGLSESEALAAVTTRPAELLGLAGRLGTIAPGKVANLTITRGALFAEGSKVREVWVDGDRHEVNKDETSPKGDWTFPFKGGTATLSVKADKDTTVTVVAGTDTLKAEAVRLEDRRLRFTARSGGQGWEYDLRAANDALAGTGAGGREVVARAKADAKPAAKPEPLVPTPQVMGITEAWRARPPEAPAAVRVRNATVWTLGPQGVLAGADVLVRGGKIAAVGKGLAAPAGAVVVDGTGKHVAPGIIDEHSHAAILGNVNECTNILTCEVRIQDVINSESVNLYRQLAGGVTAMQLLHGSCNSIGGQAAFIKSKWGEGPDGLFQSWVPGTVKFALGENPKQSNWGNDRTDRYPKTRAGVEQSIRDAFIAARDYDRAWAEFRAGQRPLPPRRDLQLDALSEIVNGRRHIHAHSYRQDEILMLIRVAEEFGIKVNTFTHILEGYKVADEMAVHGSTGMGFSDWWGYKQEVIDAIPHNGFLMWDRGVVTGFNSDSDELARRLNTEAAKAIKYGGVPREEALKFVTLNPARSMLADARLGSIEVGKDADFAIWSGEPLSPYALCEQTWIEGRKYFDRAADLAGRAELARERDALIARARAAKKDGGGGGGRGHWPPRYLEDTDMSGNQCGHSDHEGHSHPFMSEAERRARQAGEEVQR